MGCWSGTCALSNLHIEDGEPVYVFVLSKLDDNPLSKWEPIMLPIEATYDSHGAFENADGNLEYILEGLFKYKVVVDDIVSDDLKVDYESLRLSSKRQLLIEESNDGFRHYISFAMVKKSVVKSLFESLTLEDDYRRWQFSWKDIDNQIDGLIQDCLASHERAIAWNIGKCAIDFLTAQSPDFWSDEFSDISSVAKLLSLYWGDCRWGLVDTTGNVVRNCVEGNYPLAHLILKDLLTASFICETMRITRKAWMPEGTVEASQSKETAGYIAMCKAIEKEFTRRLEMERKEVVRKVQSVCGQMGAIEAARKGVVTVGSHAVLLKPEEMFVPRPPLIGCEYKKGSVVLVQSIDEGCVAMCRLVSTGERVFVNLTRLAYQSDYEAAYQSDYEAAYCDATTEQQKQEDSQVNTEDQYEWLLENPDGKMTKELSAQELKVLYDAAYTDDKNVVVDCLDACGIWYRYDTKHAPWADYIHRVKRKITATPLDIPWDLIDDMYKYAAMDKNGSVFFYKSEPFVKESREDWWPDGDDFTKSFLKHNINGVNWKRSLTKRPS